MLPSLGSAQDRSTNRPVSPLLKSDVRKATTDDVSAIFALVSEHARRGTVLPRTRHSIDSTIDDWLVAEVGGEILGCVSLLGYTSGLAEVRTLAVRDSVQGLGVGSRLVEALLVEARQRDIPKLFALTRLVPYFERFGFSVTDREAFPEKVWRDCQQCPIVDNCDETAVVMQL
jgi:N-acetylglutamate synthase-like GNAT family acetyltransferase